MKPATSRAARRLAKKSGTAGTITIAHLLERVARARIKGADTALNDRARRILTSYLQTAQTHRLRIKDVITDMASGQAAWRLGHAVRDEIMKSPPDAVRNAACARGCAFCCILSGGDGGVITPFEAAQLHTALRPLADEPDGRAWHPFACPALDPETRACRIYDARPMICRSFLSVDADACRENAAGGDAQGPGLLGSHLDYLAIHTLCRQLLKGITHVQSYSLSAVAAGAVAGQTVDETLKTARHRPAILDQACENAVRAAAT